VARGATWTHQVHDALAEVGYIVDLACDDAGVIEIGPSYDAVLLDLTSPETEALDLVRRLASRASLPPCIVVVEAGAEKVAVKAMQLGASDYVVRDREGFFIDLLPFVLGQACDRRGQVALDELQERSRRELDAVHAVSQTLSSPIGLRETLDQALSCLVDVSGFAGGSIALVEERTGQMKLVSHVGLPKSLVQHLQRQPLQDAQCDFAYRDCIPTRSEEQRKDAPVEEGKLLSAGFQSYVGAPIVHKNQALGTLCLFDTMARPMAEVDYDLLAIIGRQIGVAVENRRLFEDIMREREIAHTLLDTAEALSAILRLDQLLERVLDELQRVVPYDAASISLFSDDGRFQDGRWQDRGVAVSLVAARGMAPGKASHPPGALASFPLFQRVVEDQRPVIIADTREVASEDLAPTLDLLSACMCVPLIYRNRIVGVMMINSRTPNAYDEEMARLTFAFAHQAALAIENSRLYGQTQSQLREALLLHSVTAALASTLDREQMLPYVAHSLCELLNGSSARIYTPDKSFETVRVVADYRASGATEDEKRPVLERAYALSILPTVRETLSRARPRQLHISDDDLDSHDRAMLSSLGVQSALFLPMVAHERVVGLAALHDSQSARRFTQGEIALGQTLTHQAAVAIEHARLFHETQKSARQIEALYRTSRALSSSRDEDQLMCTILEAVHETLDCEYVLISTVDEDARKIGVRHGIWQGEFDTYPEWIEMAQYALDQSDILTDVYRTGRTEVIEGWDERFNREVWERFEHEQFLRVFMPIKMRERVIGVVEVGYDKWGKNEVSDEEIQQLTMFMDQAAVALENARLFDEASRRAREMQFLHDVSLAAVTKMGLRETLQEAAHALSEELAGTRIAFWLFSPESNLLCLEAGVGYPKNLVGNLRLKLGEGLSGWVTRHGEAASIPDVRFDRRYYQVIPGARSEMCVPLTAASTTIGALSVESPHVNAFTNDDLRLVSALASNLALLVERGRLFSEVEEARFELQQRAAALEQANARLQELDRLKDQFFASVSHEFRTPLNSIIGFAEVLLKGMMGELSTKQATSVRYILSSGEDLLAMINDILDFSKLQAGRMALDVEAFEVKSLLEEVQATITPLVEKKTQALVLDVDSDLPLLTADRFRVKQILLNLLSNANKFAPDEGQIALSCTLPDPDTMCFSVTDNGQGIKREDQEIIFEDFGQAGSSSRLKVAGTGLGLAISKRLVELHGGGIWVESEYGRGATFSFILPLDGG